MEGQPGALIALWRRIHPGGNPLARIWDRIEAAVLIGVVTAALFGVPLAAAAGSEAYANMMARSAEQLATRHATTAFLLEDAPPGRFQVDDTPSTETAKVPARWVLPDGTFRENVAEADLGAKAGDAVTVWLDDAEQAVEAPVTPIDAASTGIGVGVGVWLFSVTLLAVLYLLVRQLLERARRAAWDREWERFGQDWTRS